MKDYKKILEGVVNIINTTEKSDIGFANICTYIGKNCSELAESEDERIREEIINYFEHYPNIIVKRERKSDYIAWLEKQGEIIKEWSEMKFNNIQTELQEMVDLKQKIEQDEQKPVNLVAILNDYFANTPKEQQDKDWEELKHFNNFGWKLVEQKPAFEMKTPEESLGIDSETYNKIVDECIYELEELNPSDVSKQEPIDTTDLTDFEKCFKGMCCDKNQKFVKECCVSLLELARKQIQGEQKQEWSEEDERLRKSCIAHIEDELERIRNDKYGHSEIISDLKESCRERINWLKSLRPQNTWKPSDEQIKACKEVYADLLSAKGFDLGTVNSELNRMEEELKKPREE